MGRVRSGKPGAAGLRWDLVPSLVGWQSGRGMDDRAAPPRQAGSEGATLNLSMKLPSALVTESAEGQFRANPAIAGRTCSLLQRYVEIWLCAGPSDKERPVWILRLKLL